MRKRKLLGLILKIAGALAALFLAGVVVFVLFILPTYEISGAQEPPPTFEFNKELGIEKSARGGIKYAVNNSTATFDLDVAGADSHCERIFPDYAAALRYCRQSGLPAIPSVQLIQGKCKQFDDGLCAALEAAVQEGLPGDKRLGKRAALERLLKKLVELRAVVPAGGKAAVRRAAVHVAAALKLGGAEPELDAALAAGAEAAKQAFLARPMKSRPVGFWTRSEPLQGIFRQDRYLSQGFKLAEDLPACIALAATIAGDAELAGAFKRFREFDSRITNPPVYVDPSSAPAAPARCASFEEVAALLPPGTKLSDALAAGSLAKIKTGALKKFGPGAGFALVAYSRSKEYDLLHELLLAGEFTGREDTMALIIEAVRSGRLRLEPEPNSGWYDYQWHALETLLAPERAREAPKLKLSAAYKKRLENAFKTSLTKHRETHIKHLPVIMMGCSLDDGKEPPQVEVGPEFSAEPVATVYLRCARAYRFLRGAMHAALGEDSLKKLRRRRDRGPDLDAELRRMSLLCYGLYERLCLQIGQPPKYLAKEMTPGDVAAARAEASRWLAAPADDPDLARDTRVAVPIAAWPGGPTRYWATGGVRLERVEYSYREEPEVTGFVEPVFVPTHYYLPTDIFLEFERPGDVLLTREEYRALCDRHEDEPALRAALGAAAAEAPGGGFPYLPVILIAALLGLIVPGWRFRKELRALWARRPRRLLLKTALGAGALLLVFAVSLAVHPGWRTRFLVKYVARVNTPLGLMVERSLWDTVSPAKIDALADLLSDPNPQVRYLAARFLEIAWPRDEENEAPIKRIPGLKQRLQAAADDEVVDVAAHALRLLDSFTDQQNVDFLLAKLEASRHVDKLCLSAVGSLSWIGNPKSLDAVLPFTNDSRRSVRRAAAYGLCRYNDPRAAARLAQLVRSPDEMTSWRAKDAVHMSLYLYPKPPWEDKYNAALLAAAGNASFSPRHRFGLVQEITKPELQARAYLAILRSPSSTKHETLSECRQKAVVALRDLGRAAAAIAPELSELLKDPDPQVRKAAKSVLEEIKADK